MENQKSKIRIFTYIFISTLGVAAIIIGSLATATFFVFDKMYQKNIEKDLINAAEFIVSAIENGEDISKTAQICKEFAKKSGIRTSIIENSGKVISDSDASISEMQNHLSRPEIVKAFKGEHQLYSRYSSTLGKRMAYLAMPALKESENDFRYCVRLALPARNIEATTKLLAYEIFTLAFLAVLLAAIFSIFIARKVSVSVNNLRIAANDLSRGGFDLHIKKSNIMEFFQLGRSMELMGDLLKKRMHSLYKRNCELSEIFSHMQEAVFICSEDGMILRMNKAAAEIFNFDYKDNSRVKTIDVIKSRTLLAAIEKTFISDNSYACDIEIFNKKTSTLSLLGSMLPYESRTRRALFVMHDISHIKEIENLRKEFIAVVSHELKTPITAIKASAETLAEVENKMDIVSLTSIIEKESERMNSLVDNMLLLSKIETPDFANRKNFMQISLRSIIDEALAINEIEAIRRKQKIEIDCDLGVFIFADFTLMSIALSNLLANAIKYTPEGSQIKIAVKQLENEIELSVSDNGTGISEEHLPRIFERFYRVDKGRSRSVGGTGLGLAIVKHVAMIHNAYVRVESKIGVGTSFIIVFKKP